MRRVVVTGLGALSPLGVGTRTTWQRLVAGDSGIVSLAGREAREAREAYGPSRDRWRELPSTVAGVVPPDQWRPSDWQLDAAAARRMSRFAQYAVAAADMALDQAGWRPSRDSDREATGVCLGSGIGNLDDMYATSVAYEKDVR